MTHACMHNFYQDNFSEDKAMAHSEKRNRREANNILCLRILAWLITM